LWRAGDGMNFLPKIVHNTKCQLTRAHVFQQISSIVWHI
jgi:hypothetical protein